MGRWAGHVAGIGTMRNVYNIVVGKPEGIPQLESMDFMIILKWVLKVWVVMLCIDYLRHERS